MQRIKHISLMILTLAFVLSACSAQPTQAPPTVAPTHTLQPGRGISSEERELPLTDADVPRISLEEAQTALESGAAVIVDVRSTEAFEASHVAGAISVPLGVIERDLANVPLNRDQWIITYCT
jgi:hypothetical protein